MLPSAPGTSVKETCIVKISLHLFNQVLENA